MTTKSIQAYKISPENSLYVFVVFFFSFFWLLALLVYQKNGQVLEVIVLIPIVAFVSCLFITKYRVLIDGDRFVISKPFRRDVEFNTKSIKQLVMPMDEDTNKTVLSKPYELLILLENGRKITLNMRLFKMKDIVFLFKYLQSLGV